jgi:hypothetical protein
VAGVSAGPPMRWWWSQPPRPVPLRSRSAGCSPLNTNGQMCDACPSTARAYLGRGSRSDPRRWQPDAPSPGRAAGTSLWETVAQRTTLRCRSPLAADAQGAIAGRRPAAARCGRAAGEGQIPIGLVDQEPTSYLLRDGARRLVSGPSGPTSDETLDSVGTRPRPKSERSGIGWAISRRSRGERRDPNPRPPGPQPVGRLVVPVSDTDGGGANAARP